MWTRIFLRRRQFDSVATTKSEGATCLLGASSLLLIFPAAVEHRVFPWVFLAVFGAYLALNAKFFWYLARTEGVLFAAGGILTHWANSAVIMTGVVWGTLCYIAARLKGLA